MPSVVTKRVVRVVPGRSFPSRFAWQSDERGPRWEGVEAPLIIKTFWQLAEFVRLLVGPLSPSLCELITLGVFASRGECANFSIALLH